MRAGIALSDADRQDWLRSLANELRERTTGVVLTCSALKLRYRDMLRESAPGLRFAYLEITREEARRRLLARSQHFFPAELLDSQFDALEIPLNEAGVLRLDASHPLPALVEQTVQWLTKDSGVDLANEEDLTNDEGPRR